MSPSPSPHPRVVRRLVGVLASAAVLAGPVLASPAPAAEPQPTPAANGTGAVTTHGRPDLLDAAAHGPAALTALGEDLPTAAERNDLAPRELRDLLRTDRTAWVDTGGVVYFVDQAPARAPSGAEVFDAPGAVASAPLAETFRLHSNPTATRTIFLDFDGAEVTDTQWNTNLGVASTQPGWDPAGDGPAFADAERTAVQQVWAMVAEDYAPWQIDVTTEDPGPAGLIRSSPSDVSYGSHALITPSLEASSKVCPAGCGGSAYLGVFDGGVGPGSLYDPAWIFPHQLDDSPKAIGEAVAHEVGHHLGLVHDANTGSTSGYEQGHGAWAPIMGVAYYRPITQFSKGDYPGATEQQDDLAVVGASLALRPDEAGSTFVSRGELPLAGRAAYLTSRRDVDAFALGTCTAGSVLRVSPAAVSPDLDVKATLMAADGGVVASNDPAAGQVDAERATGLGAAVSVPTTGSGYVLAVEGVGVGDWANGYDDYASNGAYTLDTAGCDGGVGDLPRPPADVTALAEPFRYQVALTWSPPVATGSGPVTSYVVSLSGRDPVRVPATERTWTASDLERDTTYDLSVSAVNAAGVGPATTISATTTKRPPHDDVDLAEVLTSPEGRLAADNTEATGSADDPAAPHQGAGSGGLSVWYSWTPQTSGLAHLSTESVVTDRDTTLAVYTGSRGALLPIAESDDRAGSYLSEVDVPVTAGTRYLVAVDGFAALVGGRGPFDLVWSLTGDGTQPQPPGPPTAVTAVRGDQGASVAWTPGPSGTSGVTGYTVTASPGGQSTSVAAPVTSAVVTGLSNGTAYTFTVVARSAAGVSSVSAPSAAVVPAGAPTTPSGVTATRGDAQLAVTWSPAGANGSPVIGYTLTATPGGATTTVAGTNTSATLPGLANGTAYTVSVVATNDVGTSASSAPSAAATPAGAPGAVARPRGVVRRGVLVVSWTTPADHGAPIRSYEVLVSGTAPRTVDGSVHRTRIRGLAPGWHRVRVVATNDVGAGAPSPALRVRVPR